MHLEFVPLLQSQEQVAVTCDERTLRDDAERQSFATRQPLQHRSRHAEPALGRLIRIGRRTDDDAFAEWDAFQVGLERADHMFLYEDPLLECLPPVRPPVVRKLGIGQLARIVCALDDVAMRVARVTVTAAEFTADIRIERPVVHAGRGWWVEHALGSQRNEPGAAEALVENDGRLGRWADGRY